MSTKTTKFYTVAGFTRINGCCSPVTYKETFATRAKAAKFIADEVNQVIEEENDQNPDTQIDLVTAKDCAQGYGLSAFNDHDDIFELNIVEHEVEPLHAVLTFDADERTLNLTTFKTKADAEKRVAENAKSILELERGDCNSLVADREGAEEINNDEIRDAEPFIQMETIGGDFIAWTAVEIPVGKPQDITIQ